MHEGDVKQRMFSQFGFLGVFEQRWDGNVKPESAFRETDAYLATLAR